MSAVTIPHVVTKLSGGKTSLVGASTAEPERIMSEGELAAFAPDSGLDGRFLADLLSAMLAHEQAGYALYRVVAGRTTRPELRERYVEFGEETELHIQILADLVTTLGGDPMYVSPAARMTQAQGAKLLETGMLTGAVDAVTAEMGMVEWVVLAETKDHANWSLLADLARRLPASAAREAIEAAVSQVEPQEDEHLDWASSTWERLVHEQLGSPPPPATSGEDDHADYGSWTKEDLYAKAQELGIEGRSGMTKEELVEALGGT